jgi:hypothetical protein
VNDTDIKTLINSAVDAELDGHRAAPSWNPSRLPERRHPAHPVTRWSLPVLAASVAALLAAGTVVAIDHGQDRRSAPVANSATPTPSAPSPSLSLSRSADSDLEAANRLYAEAVAVARDATEIAEVAVEPLPARDAARLKDTGLISGDISGITAPKPGKTYSFTLSYEAGPSDNPPAVLTTEVQDVASGGCSAEPFLARPGHTYVIQCHAMLLAGATGKATLTLRTPTGTMSGSMNLTDPAKVYTAAVAAAPEASTVAGVSDQPASADERRRPVDSFGMMDGPAAPEQGRSYPMTFMYTPAWDAPAISVLALTPGALTPGAGTTGAGTAGHCPRPFRVRPAHSYLIRCQMTYRAGGASVVDYLVTTPQGVERTGIDPWP